MSCCGRSAQRPAIAPAPPRAMTAAAPSPPGRPLPAPPGHASIDFVYTGATRLVADGPVTRRRYRFEQAGAVVAVDGRDASSFAAIPNLRRVPS